MGRRFQSHDEGLQHNPISLRPGATQDESQPGVVHVKIKIGNQNEDLIEPPTQGETVTGMAHAGVDDDKSAEPSSDDKKSKVHDEM